MSHADIRGKRIQEKNAKAENPEVAWGWLDGGSQGKANSQEEVRAG